MNYVNNTLVVVFACQFFGTEIAALAAFYNLAYYGLMVPLKNYFLVRMLFVIHSKLFVPQ